MILNLQIPSRAMWISYAHVERSLNSANSAALPAFVKWLSNGWSNNEHHESVKVAIIQTLHASIFIICFSIKIYSLKSEDNHLVSAGHKSSLHVLAKLACIMIVIKHVMIPNLGLFYWQRSQNVTFCKVVVYLYQLSSKYSSVCCNNVIMMPTVFCCLWWPRWLIIEK